MTSARPLLYLARLLLRMQLFPYHLTLSIGLGIAACIERASSLLPARGVEDSTGRIHLVHVGEGGLFAFNPDTIRAEVGDSVTFIIHDPTHTVTQSRSLVEPCAASESGFSSEPGDSEFTIIVNDTKPILVHSEPHCTLGMVMLINPANSSDANKVTANDIARRGLLFPPPPDFPFPPANPLVDSPSDSGSFLSDAGTLETETLTTVPSRASSSSAMAQSPLTPSSAKSSASEREIQPSAAQSGLPPERPRQAKRKDAAAALATALTLSFATVAGACYMWRRRRSRMTSAVRVDALAPFRPQASERAGAMIAEPPAGGESPAAEGSVTSSQRQAASGAVEWKHKLFDSGSPVGPILNTTLRGGVEPTSMTLLRAELDRVLAENEMLRQRAEPPAYSDGARSELGAP